MVIDLFRPNQNPVWSDPGCPTNIFSLEKIMKMSRSESGRIGALVTNELNKKLQEEKIDSYYTNPKLCDECGKAHAYKKRKNKFCSASCGASYTNRNRERTKNNKTTPCRNCGNITLNPAYCDLTCQSELRQKQKIEKVLMGSATQRAVKQYLISAHGEICMNKACAWDFAKSPIGVELEHIDGNSDNNVLENCTLLCPNCHSLTPTYKNRNKGNGRHYRRERYRLGKSY